MKQILQNLGNGETILADVPCPRRGSGALLAETTRTLVSLGTEKMLIDFGKGSWLSKARSQPDKVKQVLQKVKTDGLFTTIDAVKSKLGTPVPLGYCHVGLVSEVDVNSSFAVGDRIVSNGPHAEMVSVPENLAAKIPASVTDEQAAFTVVAAIGLQGIRLANPTLGERVAVFGLGLIGLLTVQMLKAQGCHVLGIDFDDQKLKLAEEFGAETVNLSAGQDPIKAAENWTGGVGVDAVLITAATKSDELVHQAATMCRQRGRVVLVGVVGLNLRRSDFYEKEISFQVSCSYGPGRYDDNYEKRGMDYPIGFVRWTEQRNFQAVLEMMAEGKISIDPLVTHRFKFDDALNGYQAISEKGAMGILLEYGASKQPQPKSQQNLTLPSSPIKAGGNQPTIAFIGAGGFTTRMLLPLFPKNVTRKTIVSGTGVSAAHAGKQFGFKEVSTDSSAVLADPEIDAVFITTPHNTHGAMVAEGLNSGKHVFVEKPLAMTHQEVDQIEQALQKNPNCCLLTGFNRRFSPHMVAMKKWLSACSGSKAIIITVNAGAIPADHWTQQKSVGGGRIIGEACHFIDLARFLAGAGIVDSHVVAMGNDGRLGDCVSISLRFADHSIATVNYLANGSKNFPKERIEVFSGGQVLACDNFRLSRSVGGKEKLKTRSQDKGHANELQAFVDTISGGGTWPIPADEQLEVARITIDLAQQVQVQLNQMSEN